MEGEVVGSRESPLTQLTLERSVPSVFPLVPGQLVRPSKPPATALPVTDVRLLPGVGPEVGLQVAGLGVGLPTPGVVTGVGRTLPLEDHHHLWVGWVSSCLTTSSCC